MTDETEKRPAGFVPLGIFFFFGATMASYAAFTLAVPGTFLDAAWRLNPVGHAALSSLGRIMAAPLLLLASVLLVAGLGWFRRRRWGWVLGLALIAINLAGDLSNLVFREELLKGTIGVGIAGLLLTYMTRASVRNYFRDAS
jgi:hypothetical protein